MHGGVRVRGRAEVGFGLGLELGLGVELGFGFGQAARLAQLAASVHCGGGVTLTDLSVATPLALLELTLQRAVYPGAVAHLVRVRGQDYG